MDPLAATNDEASWVAYKKAADGKEVVTGMLAKLVGDDAEFVDGRLTWEPLVGLFASIPGFCFFHLVRRFLGFTN